MNIDEATILYEESLAQLTTLIRASGDTTAAMLTGIHGKLVRVGDEYLRAGGMLRCELTKGRLCDTLAVIGMYDKRAEDILEKCSIRTEIASLMGRHMREHGRMPEYLRCELDAFVEVLLAGNEQSPEHFDIPAEHVEALRLWSKRRCEDWTTPEQDRAFKHIRSRKWRIMGMKTRETDVWDVNLPGAAFNSRFILLSGKVMVPKRRGGHIYHCITDENNPLEGKVTISTKEIQNDKAK